MTFDGFDSGAIASLAELPGWDADRYAGDKARLVAGVTRPGLALIETVADRLDADLTVVARSSVSPLHRDLRFAPAGSPRYKDHLLLTTWEGSDKRSAPTFWIRVDADRAGFASGIGFSPVIRDRWRSSVGGSKGAELAAELDRLIAERDAEVAGDELKKVPTPFAADHPRGDLLRKIGFQVRFIEPLPDTIGSPAFADRCTERLSELLPVHRWLVRHLT